MIITKGQSVLIMLLLMVLAKGQNYICYSNCRQGHCTEDSPKYCTACDSAQVNINGKCISGSAQPYPLTFLTINQNDKLNNQSSGSNTFQCTVSNTSIFNQRELGSLVYETVAGTTYSKQFSIPQRNQYIKFKFNAAIVQSTTVFLQYQLSGREGNLLFGRRQPSTAPNDTTISISCLNSITVQNVFFVQHSISSQQNSITLQVKSLDNNAVFGVSNFEVYYGSCNQKCKTCNGPAPSQCLTCQGLYMRVVNGTCQTCPQGFYDADTQCRVCPPNCQSCSLNSLNKSVLCTSCLTSAQLSSGKCLTKYQHFALPSQLIYQGAYGWTSSQVTTQPLTSCGKYSLIGGISIGRQGSSLSKTFTDLQVHSQVDIYFAFFMIDQQLDQSNLYQIFVDGVLVEKKQFNVTAEQGSWELSDECGNSKPQLAFIVYLKKVKHSNTNLTIEVKSFKNWFGLRDFNLVVFNKTGVIGCFQQAKGDCITCINGLKYDPNSKQCGKCSQNYYLLNKKQCQICPFYCKSCQFDIGNNRIKCLSCPAPLQLMEGHCKDTTNALYSREILQSSLQGPKTLWTLYPKLLKYGMTTCGDRRILGASKIMHKFISMKRQFTQLPPHQGVKVYFQFYQIDAFTNQSVQFVLNGNKVPYSPTNERKLICGSAKVADAVVKVQLVDEQHTGADLVFQIIVNGKVKIGVNDFVLFLLNCQGCKNHVNFKLESIPQYSLTTPPVKGVQIKLLFDQRVYNGTPINQAFKFAIQDPNLQATEIETRLLQGLVQYNDNLPIVWEQVLLNKEYRAFIALDKDFNKNKLVANPVNFWQLSTNAQQPGRTMILSSFAVTRQMQRYIDIDENNIDNRKNIRNLRNFFQGCAIFALWIGLASFVFGFSPVFDDFFILVQVVFAHIFIQLAYSPPSLRVPLQGMQIVQFMAWLPWQARSAIQKGIIANDLYQRSPIEYEQYYKDIVFARTIYHTILFLIFGVVLFIMLKLFSHIITISQKSKRKYADSYIVKYYIDYQAFRFAFVDKFMRFAYFTAVWACSLQFVGFKNQPEGFNIWNSVVCIFVFVVFVLYPVLGFVFLKRVSSTISQNTFDKNYDQVRVRSSRLPYFVWRYYKLLLVALLIGLMYDGNPLAILIPLIVAHVADGVIIVVFKPFSLTQQTQLNVYFYNYYPKVYWLTSAIQSFLLAFLQLFILISYAVRDTASNYSYLGLGYTCCAIVIALLINGLVKLIWGFIKIVEGCFSKSKQMKLNVENKMVKEKQTNEEMVPIKSMKQLANNLNSFQSKNRMASMRKQTQVSKIN